MPVRPDAPEPVRRRSGIGFLAVKNSMPETPLCCGEVLSDAVGFLETGEIEPQAGKGRLRGIGRGKKLRSRSLRYLL